MAAWDDLSVEQRQAHWAETARRINRLLEALRAVLSEAELEVVRGFADHNEYGLAVETVYDYLAEEPRRVPREAVRMIQELADRMALRSRKWASLEELVDR